MADCELYVLETVTNRTSMNSTITITDTDDEVVELDQDDVVRDNGESKDDFEPRECDLSSSDVIGDCKFIEKTPNVSENSELCQHVESPNNSRPVFKVIFQNENVARQYEKEIRLFLQNLVFKTTQKETDSSFSDIILEIWEKEDNCDQQVLDTSTKSEDSQDVLPLFTIDTQPAVNSDTDVPTYGKEYKYILEKEDGKETEPEEKDICIPKIACFNCFGNHNLQDCKEPRNRVNINKNRKELNIKGNSKSLRYHLENEQRFGHMIPGQISKNLRDALGLKNDELPKHIYRMRMLGYPPGWLEEARLQHSGISLFNSEGVAESDPTDEPGEIISEGDKDQYDINKIFDFPGFNVPPPPGTHDDHKRYWSPQKQAIHSKKIMLLYLSGKKAEGYKRKKLKLSAPVGNYENAIPTDMDIEDLSGVETMVKTVPVNGHFIPPLPKDSPMKPPEPSSSVLTPEQCSLDYRSQDSADGSASPLSRANSPSLSDLESIKKQLLVELEDSSSQSNPGTPARCNPLNPSTKTEVVSTPNNNTSQPIHVEDVQSTLNTSQGSVKSVDLGTPVLQSMSPYNKLPSSEKFSKNICDVINFENLPDSTGKYEQMTGVLQKVRDTLAKLQDL